MGSSVAGSGPPHEVHCNGWFGGSWSGSTMEEYGALRTTDVGHVGDHITPLQ